MKEPEDQGADLHPTYHYRYAEQNTPPQPKRVSDVALSTFEHVFEVDPRLMQRWVLQQTFPNWDSLRIMNSRHDHLDWMHRHFADIVINGSSLLDEIEAESSASGPADSTITPASTQDGSIRTDFTSTQPGGPS